MVNFPRADKSGAKVTAVQTLREFRRRLNFAEGQLHCLPMVNIPRANKSGAKVTAVQTLRVVRGSQKFRASVLECGGPPPLFDRGAFYSRQRLNCRHGKTATEDLPDSIFSRFCIGK